MKRSLSLLLMLMIAAAASAQEKRMAVVEFSTAYLRLQPDYESPLETQELMGTVVEIVGEQSYWKEVVTPQPYRAWCTDQGLVEMSAEGLKAYEEAPKLMYTGLYGHIYVEPSFRSATVCDLVGGDVLRPGPQARLSRKSADRALKGRWTQVMLPSGKTGYVPSKELRRHEGFTSIAMGEGSAESISSEQTEKIIAEAEKLLGVPYLWGGMSAKGTDCSGLVRICHILNGILLPRNASQQVFCGERVEIPRQARNDNEGVRHDSEEVRKMEYDREAALEAVKNLQRGDLVYFGTPATDDRPMRITHVGIYLGGNRMIHSSHRVRINSLIPGDADYYENSHRLVAATRL
ncbi:MAG: NlpC/P60 family protein [Bacteroidales bacterium]|nr:NlpC/P60 family protein [Bacteroidales bacterium]